MKARPVLALIVVAGLALAACGGAGGVSKAQAIDAARRNVFDEQATVVSAETGLFVDFDDGATDVISRKDRRVWAVVFSGSFAAGSCGPAGNACPPPAHTMMVIVDRADGSFIMSRTPAP